MTLLTGMTSLQTELDFHEARVRPSFGVRRQEWASIAAVI